MSRLTIKQASTRASKQSGAHGSTSVACQFHPTPLACLAEQVDWKVHWKALQKWTGKCTQNLLVLYLSCFGALLLTYRSLIGSFFVLFTDLYQFGTSFPYRSFIGPSSVSYRSLIGPLAVLCRSFVVLLSVSYSSLSGLCRSLIGPLSVIIGPLAVPYRSFIGRLSVPCRSLIGPRIFVHTFVSHFGAWFVLS